MHGSSSPTSPGSASPASCVPKRTGRTISLPVLKSGGKANRSAWSGQHDTIAHSKMGKWRAIVLTLVHVVIAAHVIQWLITGLTLSPVEPSESMHTLRDGVVNAGFVFFVLAIVSTLIMGRFFCGWACHVVALQDACSWLMTKCRVKPKPFRSRLLVFVPLILAIYMFIWPVLMREVFRPLLADERGRLPIWLGQIDPLPGIRTDFIVDDFWATFPTWYIAIPFLAVCGFACVYFLGSKGFCTYGCPYGGFFGPADLLAPGKIRVDDSKCHHCGHCTAVCTSNVRVHDEVRDYGMVVDPGCMKCLDCVSVCPNDALYVGLGRPTILAKVKPGAKESAAKAKVLRDSRFDLSRTEEVVCAGLFLLFFVSYRGMLNQVPMLMAVGMAGIMTFCTWKLWRLLRDPNVRLQSFQLKFKGRLRLAGVVFALTTLFLIAAAAWSGYVRLNVYRAQLAYQSLETPIDVVLRPDFAPVPDELAAATKALTLYARADAPAFAAAGAPQHATVRGFGWPLRADDWVNITYLRLLTGDRPGAEAALRHVVSTGNPRDNLILQLEGFMRARGATDADVQSLYAAAVAQHDELFQIHDRIARRKAESGDPKGAAADIRAMVDRHPVNPAAPLQAASFFLAQNDQVSAVAMVDRALTTHGVSPSQKVSAAALLLSLQQRERALKLLEQAQDQAQRDSGPRMAAASLLAQASQPDAALAAASSALEASRKRGRYSGQAAALVRAGMLNIQLGKSEDGLKLVQEAVDLVRTSPWDIAPAGVGLVQAGLQTRQPKLVDAGIGMLKQARDLAPNAPTLRHDLAVALGYAGKMQEAGPELKAAAELAKHDPGLAERYSLFLRSVGEAAEADRWLAEARRRQQRSP